MTVKQLRDIINSLPPNLDNNIVVSSDEDEIKFIEMGRFRDGTGTYFFDPYSNEICTFDPIEFKNHDEYMKHVSQYPDQLFPCVVLLP